nr:MAG: matrix protein [Le Dantec virus]
MFSRFKRSLSKKGKNDDNQLLYDPPAYDSDDFFAPIKPSAPDLELEDFRKETLHVEAELIIKTHAGIKTMEELLKILGIWIDQCSGPIRQRHLDLWVYLCLGLHVRRDVGIKSYNVYRAALDSSVVFLHAPKTQGKFQFVPCHQFFTQKYRGKDCDIDFTCKFKETKRTGTPAHTIYNQVLKSGFPPPKPIEVFAGYDVTVSVNKNGEHEIAASAT